MENFLVYAINGKAMIVDNGDSAKPVIIEMQYREDRYVVLEKIVHALNTAFNMTHAAMETKTTPHMDQIEQLFEAVADILPR